MSKEQIQALHLLGKRPRRRVTLTDERGEIDVVAARFHPPRYIRLTLQNLETRDVETGQPLTEYKEPF